MVAPTFRLLSSVGHVRARSAAQVNRHVLINHQTNETFVKHLTPEQEKDTSHFVDKETGAALSDLLLTFKARGERD